MCNKYQFCKNYRGKLIFLFIYLFLNHSILIEIMIVSNWKFEHPIALFATTGIFTILLIIMSITYNRRETFIVPAIIWVLSAGILLILQKKPLENINIDIGLFLILYSIALYTNLVFIRLYNQTDFSSTILNFDFGPKPNSTEHSIAFDNVESIGHVLWGLLIIPLFDVFQLNRIWKLMLNETMGICLFSYPIYNLIKRMLFSFDDFSRSSYYNNQLEWLSGTYIGILIAVIILNNRKQNVVNEVSYSFRIIVGIFMLLSTCVAYGMTSITWNNMSATVIMSIYYPAILVSYIMVDHYFTGVHRIKTEDTYTV
jgi:hypothetical protein